MSVGHSQFTAPVWSLILAIAAWLSRVRVRDRQRHRLRVRRSVQAQSSSLVEYARSMGWPLSNLNGGSSTAQQSETKRKEWKENKAKSTEQKNELKKELGKKLY